MIGVGSLVAVALASAPGGSALAAGEPPTLGVEIRGEPTAVERVEEDLAADLGRTPLRHRVVFDAVGEWEGRLAHVTVDLNGGGAAKLHPMVGGGRRTPGWLVHAVLQAADAIEVDLAFVDRRSSWTGQLAARAIAGPESAAMGAGVPAIHLQLPAADASGLLAAVVRRLDRLESAPAWEDVYLVLGGRVRLRRDLYWLGLVLWLALFVAGRRRRRREGRDVDRDFRWATAGAWLVSPAAATVLLTLPVLTAVLRPSPRWSSLALLPSALFAVRWIGRLTTGASPAIALVPTLLVGGTLLLFGWAFVGRPGAAGAD